ncbi:hypothetical protein BOX37_23265 [Nocardia mangyaensis]|uniref:Uncharacterized protein n=1 Tax=Nocardia mangyaensis TaxID=2213200 RepID=A0A1J0VWC5_9NOCA|nr:hypothetical protein BOX37_23265 [Nocardia mangyaensis]
MTVLASVEEAEAVADGIAESGFAPEPGHVGGRLVERDTRADETGELGVEVVGLEVEEGMARLEPAVLVERPLVGYRMTRTFTPG